MVVHSVGLSHERAAEPDYGLELHAVPAVRGVCKTIIGGNAAALFRTAATAAGAGDEFNGAVSYPH